MRCCKNVKSILSLGGRIVLGNIVPDAHPSYVMSSFPMPVTVQKRIDGLRRNFIWQGNKEKNSLLLKFLWKFNMEE